jgi:hypothetical protein
MVLTRSMQQQASLSAPGGYFDKATRAAVWRSSAARPPDGPLRCLQALLARFPHAYPDKDELRSAVRHANYCSRPLAAQCIERHLAGDS